jgi:hypothetical protein
MRAPTLRTWPALVLCLAVGACAAAGAVPPPAGGRFIHLHGDDYPGPAPRGGYSNG